MPQIENRLFSKILILLGFLLTALFAYGHFIDGDVIQILDKAHILVTQNKLIPYGNVSSSGASGNIPGAFLTLATGVPMTLWFSPWAALTFLGLLHFLALLMFNDVMREFLGVRSLFLVVVFFWLNPWRLSEVFLWNPGYIYFASALHMWSAYKLSKKPSFNFSVLHGMSLFLGLQIHPSFIILFFMTMILLWMKALKPHILGTLSGIVLGLLTLVPYFLEGLEDPSIFPQPGSGDGKGYLFFGLVNVYPLLKGFWYWILFGSNIFQTHVFHKVHFDWLGGGGLTLTAKILWTGIKYLIGAAGVALSFYVNFQFYKANKEKLKVWKYKMKESNEWIFIYPITAFVSALIATGIAPTLPIYWHLLYIWPMAIIPLLIYLNKLLDESARVEKTKKYLVVVTIYFCFSNLFAAIGSKKHDLNKPFHDLYFQACEVRCTMEQLNKKADSL